MSFIEKAEFFEKEMNPNLYAGATVLAELVVGEEIDYGGQAEGSVIEKYETDQHRADLPA